ncbi:restriction endonuclease subunit S [Levilactobacillus namurensis]|uniref:restriction endonuclease subunit S n=1 Tax=Levilactobacillus namurensis TaxID=380393 RepID=UPI0026EA26DA|nr:restriction endonuclease subunit S [Levilactobacillus namurensis]
MSKKLTPNVRFKGFSDDWEQRKLGQVASRVTRKNKNLESTLPLTISAQNGLVDQREFFDKVVASKNVSGYFLVKKGEFAYNKSYSKGYPVGAIKRLDKYSMGVLSTLYIVFTPEKVNSQFLATYYESTSWYREVIKVSAEGARNHGLLNISPNDFFSTKLEIPVNSKEQENIGEVISFIDEIIASNQKQLDQLKTLKKLFLQKIFDQEWRFKGFTDPWEQRNLKNSLSLLKDGTHGSHKDGNYSMLLSTKNLVGGKVVFDKMIDRKIGKEDYQSIFKGYTLQSEDILLSVVGSIGRVSVYQPVDVPIAFQRSVAILRSKGQLIQGFLRYSLETYKIQHQMKMKTTISAQPDLFLGDLGQITITFPNIKTQVKITKILNNITETIASNQKQLDQLKQLKKWFLQNLFV